MQLVKASKKPMLQGAEKQKDLENIIFSPNGEFVISIDRTFGVKLWNAIEQTLITEFLRMKAHYATFTPDSQKLILVGRSQISIFELDSLKEIKRIENGHAMGTIDCSPDNLHLAYSNSSQLWVLDLVNFQRLYHIPRKNVGGRNQTKTSEDCFPFFVKFNKKTNDLFTSSLNSGQLCKWELPGQNSNKGNSSELIKVKASRNLRSIVSDIDFSDEHLLVSSDRNRRRLFIMNPENFEKVATRIMPKSFFLDFNTEVHSTYSQFNDVIISMTVPGDFLFFHNGTDLNFIKSENISINTYAITYDENRNILALGGQVANRETGQIQDQVLFYKIVRECDQVQNTKSWQRIQNGEERTQRQLISICECGDGFSWNSKSQSCKKIDCELNPQSPNSCLCRDPKEKWNPRSSKCQLHCQSIKNSFKSYPISLPQICPCKNGFRWDAQNRECHQINCRKMEGSFGRLDVRFSLHACECREKFGFDERSLLCILDCEGIGNSTGQPSVFMEKQSVQLSRQKCFCLDGFFWSPQSYSCLERIVKPPPNPNPQPDPQPNPQPSQSMSDSFPIVAIIIPIFLILALCLMGIIIFCWYKRCKIKKKSEEKSDTECRTENTDEDKGKKYIIPELAHQRRRKHRKNRGKAEVGQLKEEISEIIDELEVQEKDFPIIERNSQNSDKFPKKTSEDNNKTRKYRRRKIDRLDKTAKILMDQLQSDRPIIQAIKKKRKPQRNARQKPRKQKRICEMCFQYEADSKTPCGHYFHFTCIEKSIKQGGKECPACWSVLHAGIKQIRLLYVEEDFVLQEEVEEFQSEQFAQNYN